MNLPSRHPAKKVVKLGVSINGILHKVLRKEAAHQGLSMTKLVERNLVELYDAELRRCNLRNS